MSRHRDDGAILAGSEGLVNALGKLAGGHSDEVYRRFATSDGLWLPESKRRSGRVDDDAHPTGTRHFSDVQHDLGAQ